MRDLGDGLAELHLVTALAAASTRSICSPFTYVPLRRAEVLDVALAVCRNSARVHLRDERVVAEHDAAAAAASDRELVGRACSVSPRRDGGLEDRAGAARPRGSACGARAGGGAAVGTAAGSAGRRGRAQLAQHDPHHPEQEQVEEREEAELQDGENGFGH